MEQRRPVGWNRGGSGAQRGIRVMTMWVAGMETGGHRVRLADCGVENHRKGQEQIQRTS